MKLSYYVIHKSKCPFDILEENISLAHINCQWLQDEWYDPKNNRQRNAENERIVFQPTFNPEENLKRYNLHDTNRKQYMDLLEEKIQKWYKVRIKNSESNRLVPANTHWIQSISRHGLKFLENEPEHNKHLSMILDIQKNIKQLME